VGGENDGRELVRSDGGRLGLRDRPDIISEVETTSTARNEAILD
jgi:hypothetical protein